MLLQISSCGDTLRMFVASVHSLEHASRLHRLNILLMHKALGRLVCLAWQGIFAEDPTHVMKA